MEDPQGLPLQWQGPPPGTMPVLNTCRRSPRHQNDAGTTTLVQHANTHQVDPNPPRFEIIKSDDQSDDPTTSSEEAESVESPPADVMPTTSRDPLANSSATATTVPTVPINEDLFVKLSESILQGVNALIENSREKNQSMLHSILESTERQTQGTLEHQQVLLSKLDNMGNKISTSIAAEITGMRAEIDRMNTLQKASTDVFLAQLHGISDPTKVAGPSTIDATTPLPTDGLKLTFQTPPTPTPHLPPRDEGTPKGPPKGSFSPTKPMSRGNSRPKYIRQSPRTPPWHFATPPGRNPRGPPGPPNPGGGDRGGPGRGPGGSPGGDHGGGPPGGGPPGVPPGDPPGGDEPGGSDPGDDDEPHDEDLDHHPEDDENENKSPPPRRSKAPSGYNWDQLNSMAWSPGLKPRAQESLKNAITPFMNAFTKQSKTPLATCSDAHQSPLVPTHT